jgi:hypothetical protein
VSSGFILCLFVSLFFTSFSQGRGGLKQTEICVCVCVCVSKRRKGKVHPEFLEVHFRWPYTYRFHSCALSPLSIRTVIDTKKMQ